jgi:hypothetical protein
MAKADYVGGMHTAKEGHDCAASSRKCSHLNSLGLTSSSTATTNQGACQIVTRDSFPTNTKHIGSIKP